MSKERKQTDLKRSRYMCRRVGRLRVKEGEGNDDREGGRGKMGEGDIERGRENETSEVR